MLAVIYWHTFTSHVPRYTLFVLYYLSPPKFCALFSKTLQLITATLLPPSTFPPHPKPHTNPRAISPYTATSTPASLFSLAPIRSIVPHDPATDCLRSILDTSSVFEVATPTLSACSSRKPGRQNSSSSSSSNVSDSSRVQSEFSERNEKRDWEALERFSRCHFSIRHCLSVLLVVLRLKRTRQSFCKQGILNVC